jgi:hypothetical protein
LGRNTFRDDGIFSFDFAASRPIEIAEHKNLEIRLEIFNILNRTQFAVPVRILGAPGFGSSARTIVDPRTAQIAVRFKF